MPRKAKTEAGNTLASRIGQNIKKVRLKAGITQQRLAEALGIETVTVSRIETGAQMPAIDRLDEIAKELQISLTTLLADSDKADGMGKLISEAVKDLPSKEQEFVYSFAVSYAQHWKANRRS